MVLLDEVVDNYGVRGSQERLETAWNLCEFHSGNLEDLHKETQHYSEPLGLPSTQTHLLEVLVIVNVLPLSGVLQSVATDILPNSIDNVRTLGSMDA